MRRLAFFWAWIFSGSLKRDIFEWKTLNDPLDLPLCVGQSIGGRGRLGGGVLGGELGGRLLEGEALGEVAHVGDADVEDGLQFLGKRRVELHPGHKGWKKKERTGGRGMLMLMLMLLELIDVLA